MSCDLRRLRLHGIIERIPKTQRYRLTRFGLKTALFYRRIQQRLLRRGLSELHDHRISESSPLALAWSQFHQVLDDFTQQNLAA